MPHVKRCTLRKTDYNMHMWTLRRAYRQHTTCRRRWQMQHTLTDAAQLLITRLRGATTHTHMYVMCA
jgi:hypothetical protein